MLTKRLPKIVLTGGPGAGKTAVLELARQHFKEKGILVPEAASIIFGGGFGRHPTQAGIQAAQRAIYYVQRELERMVMEENQGAFVLCDRGTIDGAAYWPGSSEDFWMELGTTKQKEFARYDLVIHLRTPSGGQGYNFQNPLRKESALEATLLDEKIRQLWVGHPRVEIIDSTDAFINKANQAIALLERELFFSPL